MTGFYADLEQLMQSKLVAGWQEFRRSKSFGYCKEFHDFLWKDAEYTHIHRKRLPHGPYEYAARYVGIPLMDTLLTLGIHMNTWFPGFYDIEDEFAGGRQPIKHPKGRASQMVLLVSADFSVRKLCKIELAFELMHSDVDEDFGFKVPKVTIVERYCDEPERFVRLSRATGAIEPYHRLGDSWVF
jgi:hypothetical protein